MWKTCTEKRQSKLVLLNSQQIYPKGQAGPDNQCSDKWSCTVYTRSWPFVYQIPTCAVLRYIGECVYLVLLENTSVWKELSFASIKWPAKRNGFWRMCSASRLRKLQNTHGDLLLMVLWAKLAESSHPTRRWPTASMGLAGLDPRVTVILSM